MGFESKIENPQITYFDLFLYKTLVLAYIIRLIHLIPQSLT